MNLFNEHQAIIASEQVEYESLLPLRYTFKYQNIPFECDLAKSENADTIHMRLKADLGVLPYSSENMTRRTELLGGLGRLIARGQVAIDHHCSITMSFDTLLNNGLNAKNLVEAIVYTLLDARDTIKHISDLIGPPSDCSAKKISA